jgi:hypothetical protein
LAPGEYAARSNNVTGKYPSRAVFRERSRPTQAGTPCSFAPSRDFSDWLLATTVGGLELVLSAGRIARTVVEVTLYLAADARTRGPLEQGAGCLRGEEERFKSGVWPWPSPRIDPRRAKFCRYGRRRAPRR